MKQLLAVLLLLLLPGCGDVTETDPIHADVTLDEPIDVTLEDDASVRMQGRTEDGTYQVPLIDTASRAGVTINPEHHKLHNGDMFTVFEVNDLGNGANRTLLIVTPDTARWAHLVWEFEHELEASVEFYVDPVYTANGTIVPSFNRNGNSSKNATTLVYHSPTLIDAGTLIATIQQGAGKKAGGSDRVANEFILKQNTAYLARITNATANPNLTSMKFNWYEQTNRSP